MSEELSNCCQAFIEVISSTEGTSYHRCQKCLGACDPMEENEVLAFISYLNSEIDERPQCMMVAMMLKLKFDGAQVYHSSPGHAITEIDGICYDWDGIAVKTERFIEFPQQYGDNHIVGHYNAIAEKFRR